MATDKLDHALMLCEQGGLLAVTDGAYELTVQGNARLWS
jgi:hypothetical protein